ncbi:GumC family protein [Rhodopila globiformis]|nr:Wzz/FepE/Etk N-terminal domain-containing protein [Rhodopila globiformis]
MAAPAQLTDVLSALRRRRWLIMTISALGTSAVLGAAIALPPHYTAKAQVVVEPQQTGLLAGQTAMIMQTTDEPTVLTEMTAISSHDQLQQVLDSLGKDSRFGHMVAPPRPAKDQGGSWHLQDWLPQSLFFTPTNGWLDMRRLERTLKVYQEAGSHVVAVSFTAGNPRDAAAVANRVVELYVERQREAKRAATDRALAWVTDRIQALQSESTRIEMDLQNYQRQNGLADTERSGVVDQDLADLSRQLASAEANLATRHMQFENALSLKARGAATDTLAGLFDTPALADLRHKEMELSQQQVTMGSTYLAQSPRLQIVKNQLQQVREAIQKEIDRGFTNLINNEQAALAEVRSIRSRLDNLQRSSSDISVRTLERQATLNHQLYISLLQRQEELQQQREGLSPNVEILSLAAPPERPSSPSPILFAPPALIGFTIIGCFIAVIRDRLDETFRSENQVTTLLGLPCIGVVPQVRLPGNVRVHEYLLSKPFSPYAEAIRSVVASLQLMPESRSAPKAILVTSSLPGEGKTTLAVSFAVYAAQLGRRVLLVDLDLRNPSIPRELASRLTTDAPQPGHDGHAIVQSIQHLPGLHLDYLPLRRSPATDPVLFVNARVKELLDSLREQYDCILIDSAPLLSITETRLLATMADRILFVIKWGSTRRDVARSAISVLRNSGMLERDCVKLTNIVVTQVNPKQHAAYSYVDPPDHMLIDSPASEGLQFPQQNSGPSTDQAEHRI